MSKRRIAAVADLHGQLPLSIPECDLLIVAGDICPDFDRRGPHAEQQAVWLKREFGPWLYEHRHRYEAAVLTWGNHDYVGELLRDTPDIWLPTPQREQVEVCVDSTSKLALYALGLRVWLSPWSLRFFDWAWMASDEELVGVYRRVPDHLDILVTHGPPAYYCDRNMRRDHCGSHALFDRLREMDDNVGLPQALVCGHIHEGRGTDTMEKMEIYNVCAYKTSQPLYMVSDPIVTFDVEVRGESK